MEADAGGGGGVGGGVGGGGGDGGRGVGASRAGAGRVGTELSEGLTILGLHPGETVRWRSTGGARWHTGKVSRRERDGSIGVTDARGALRSLPVERLEVRCSGPRGGLAWEPLHERASRAEQLRLL